MTPRTRIPLYLLLVLIFGGWQLASGQANTAGSLTGTVTDPSGALVSGASLTLTQPSTGFHRSTTANSTGLYSFPELQPGQYILKATASGFADSVYNGVTVQTGRTLDLAVQMKLGTSQQTVDVSETGEVLETTTNTLATTISTEAIQDLPLNGRDSLPFAQLVSGAQSGGDQRFETFNAMPSAAINITVDGMTNNFQRYKTATSAFFNPAPLRIDAVDEFTVSTSDLTADAGAEGGATLRFSLKHGTNHFHGKAFWQTQNSAFNANTFANNALGVPKAKYHLSDFGASLGGPFWKDKLFFFVNFEQEYVPGNSTGYAQVLTSGATGAQNGNYSYVGTDNTVHTVNVLQIAGANGFPSTVNPIIASEFSQINTATSKALTTYATQLPYQTGYEWRYRANSDQIFPTARIDYQIRPNIDWHVAYDVQWSTYPPSQIYPGDPYTNNSFNATYSTFTTGLTWTITPKLVNQLNAGLLNTQEEFNVGHPFSDPFTSENDIIINSPTFVNGYSTVSPYLPNYYLPEPRNSPVRDVNDLLTWTRGKHSFTFGGEFRDATDFDTGFNDPAGYTLGINSQDPALGLFTAANFPDLDFTQTNQQDLLNAENLYATLTGRVSSVYGTNYVDAVSHQYQTLGVFKQPEQQLVGGFYMQDAWRPTAHLALNYGFRWQFSGAIHNTNNTYTNPTYADLLGPSKELFHPGVDGNTNPQVSLRPSPYSGDMRQPAPNVGFAWNPDFGSSGLLAKLTGGSKLVVRGGGGVTWYDEGWITFEQVTEFSNPGDTQVAYLNAGDPANTPAGEFPAGSLTLGTKPTLNLAPTSFSFPVPESDFTFGNQSFATVDPKIRSPYIENWYFGLQRQLPGNTVFEVNYIGNHSVHEWQVYDLNEVNIFENGFLSEFKAAQANLAASGGTSFGGSNPTPIMTQAGFGAGANPAFSNPNYINLVQSGQAGALANAIATSSTYFCNLVGNGGGVFTPCAGHPSTQYPINIFQANPFATGEPIQLLSDPGSTSYNGLQAQIKHPAGHGLMFMANYTYSHSFTNRYIGDYYTADAAEYNYTTLRNPRMNRSPSPYDQRHVFRAFAVYNLPFHAHEFALKELANGWTLSPIFQWSTGRNFKLLGGTNTYNDYDSSYPDASDSGVVLNGITTKDLQKNVGYYGGPSASIPRLLMNPKVFTNGQVTSETTPGQLGQFVYLHGPQVTNTDLAVTKLFPIFHEINLSLQAEMLNLFNHPQWAVVDGFSGGTNNPAQYVNVTNNPAVPATQTNPQGLNSGGSRDIQFRAQIVF